MSESSRIVPIKAFVASHYLYLRNTSQMASSQRSFGRMEIDRIEIHQGIRVSHLDEDNE